MTVTVRHLWLLVAVLLLLCAVGARGLNADPIWVDEANSIEDAGGPITGPFTLADIWSRIARINPWHPPGYHITLSFWGRLVGWEPAVLRALSLLAGLLAVAWTYRLGADVVRARVGLAGALVLASSAFFAHFLHELRMYAILAALSACVVWLYARLVSRARMRLPGALGFFFGAVGLLYVHYFGAAPLVALGLYHLLAAPRTRNWWPVTAIFALAVVAFLPWLGTLFVGVNTAASAQSLREQALSMPDLISHLITQLGNGYALLFLAVAALALLARGRGMPFLGFLVVAMLGLLLVVHGVLQVISVGRLRYFMPLWPLLALIAGAGFLQLGRSPLLRRALGRAAVIVPLLLWIGLGVQQTASARLTRDLDGTGYIFPFHRMARDLIGLIQSDDLVVQVIDEAVEARYSNDRLRRIYFAGVPADFDTAKGSTDSFRQNDELRQLEEKMAGRQRVWLAYAPDQPMTGLAAFQALLETRYERCPALTDTPELHIDQYALAPVCCLARGDTPGPRIQFGDGIGLLGFETVEADSEINVTTFWSLAPSVPPHVYSVALHLLDAAGNRVAQADYGLTPLAFTCHQARLNTANLLPGEYRLMAGVYAWQSGERLPGVDTETNEQGDMLPLVVLRLGDDA